MASDKTLAARTVTGVVAGMVTVTAAATAVGFWLSYGGLHEFAVRSGLAGAEAWAWPASVDLFIAAGEAGVTISALRSQRDRGAWLYLALGLVASVTGNVLHVHPGRLAWTPYAVAAVPPLAAMLALAALLRHVYRLAIDRNETAETAAGVVSAEVPGDAETAARAALAASIAGGNPLSANQLMTRFRLTRAQATKVRQANGHQAPGEAAGSPAAAGP